MTAFDKERRIIDGKSSPEVGKIHYRKHNDDRGEPKAEHVTHVVSRYALSGPILCHHSLMFVII